MAARNTSRLGAGITANCEDAVYRLSTSGEIGASYIDSARAVIRTRLAQAGARLAWILNEILPK
jgi:hypothetical protein